MGLATPSDREAAAEGHSAEVGSPPPPRSPLSWGPPEGPQGPRYGARGLRTHVPGHPGNELRTPQRARRLRPCVLLPDPEAHCRLTPSDPSAPGGEAGGRLGRQTEGWVRGTGQVRGQTAHGLTWVLGAVLSATLGLKELVG